MGEEIDLKQTFDDDDDIGLGAPIIPEDDEFAGETVVDDLTGFGLEDENGDAIEENDEEFADDGEFTDEM